MKKSLTKVFTLFLALILVIPMALNIPAYAMYTTSKNTMWYNPENHKGFYETAVYINSYSEVISEDYNDTYHLEITNLDGTIEKVYPDGKTFYRTIVKNPDMVNDPDWISKTYYYIDKMYTRSYTLPDKEDPKIVDETVGDFIIGNGKLSLRNQYGNDVDTFFTHILKKYNGKGGNVVIPEGIEVIDSATFKGQNGITSITIPNSVQYIEGNAFSGCTGLTSIIIPTSVKRICTFAFSECTNLTSVIIPGNPEFWDGVFVNSNPKLVIYSDSSHVKFYRKYDGLNVKPLSQTPIAKGSLTVDTTSYSLSSNSSYTIGTGIDGYGGTVKASSNNSNTATVTKLGNGKFKVTGVKAGTTSIVFGVYNSSNKQIAHISVLVTVQNGIASSGNATKQTVTF